MNIKASQMEAIGVKVTTISEYDSVGMGYVLPDECYKEPLPNVAWQSGGNGWYYPAEFKEVRRDGGQGYRDAVNRLVAGGGLSPAYTMKGGA